MGGDRVGEGGGAKERLESRFRVAKLSWVCSFQCTKFIKKVNNEEEVEVGQEWAEIEWEREEGRRKGESRFRVAKLSWVCSCRVFSVLYFRKRLIMRRR